MKFKIIQIMLEIQMQMIFFKYDFNDDYRSMDVTQDRRSRRMQQSLQDYELKSLYKLRIPRSAAKFRDLRTLCERGLFPSKYHTFYNELPYDGRNDTLSEPDNSDESDTYLSD